MFMCVLGRQVASKSFQYPKLSEGGDRVGGQLRGGKECPFSGVTKSGRVWRKVPESGARSVYRQLSLGQQRLAAPEQQHVEKSAGQQTVQYGQQERSPGHGEDEDMRQGQSISQP